MARKTEQEKREFKQQLKDLRKDIASRIIDCMDAYNLKYSWLGTEIYESDSAGHQINTGVLRAKKTGDGVNLDTLLAWLSAAEKLARDQEKMRADYKNRYGGLNNDLRTITRN